MSYSLLHSYKILIWNTVTLGIRLDIVHTKRVDIVKTIRHLIYFLQDLHFAFLFKDDLQIVLFYL